MSDTIAVSGIVGTEPRHTVTAEGLAITSFRLASSQRRFNRSSGSWENGETNWYTVSAFRALAINSARSVTKGDHVVVSGRLRIRAWDTGEKSGVSADLEADSLGHDLTWGQSSFTRLPPGGPGSSESGSDRASGEHGGDGFAPTGGADAWASGTTAA